MSNNETKDIEPALAPEEWKAGRVDLGDGWGELDFGTFDHLRIYIEDDEHEESAAERTTKDPDNMIIMMAAANAALPCDDPHKITSWDVATVRAAAVSIRQSLGEGEFMRGIDAIAAKLAALLPPE